MGAFEYQADADYGVWTRAVERVVDALELDFWPAEGLVNQIIADNNLTDPDEGDQMNLLEEELMAAYE